MDEISKLRQMMDVHMANEDWEVVKEYVSLIECLNEKLEEEGMPQGMED